jgi:hypothetical protein
LRSAKKAECRNTGAKVLTNNKLTNTNAWFNWKKSRNDFRLRC